ncbi:MAG TPA: hypothetical protein VJQ61_03175 [Sinomonas sp.]|nr:hypothetical protein [Sinomonas sp.]
MSDRWGKTALRGICIVVFLVMTVVLVWRLNDFGSMPRAAQNLWVPAYSLYTLGVLMFLGLTVPARRARRAAAVICAERPDAVVVRTYWSALYTAYFLKPGPLCRKARGRGGYLLLVADHNGIELIRPRGRFSFGLVPWGLVRDIRLDALVAPLASRPKLVIEIQGDTTPYKDLFELLPEGKDERARAAESFAAIMAKGPIGQG